MSFHLQNCGTAMNITRRRTVLPSQYHLHGHTLGTETEAKYLRVKITADLRWDAQITRICNKANKTLGFLGRNIKTATNDRLKKRSIQSIRAHRLCLSIGSGQPACLGSTDSLPTTSRHCKKFRGGRAVRWVKQNYRRSACVDTMRQQLHWPTLKKRRKQARLDHHPASTSTTTASYTLGQNTALRQNPTPQENHPAHTQPHLRHSAIPPDSIYYDIDR